MRKLLVLLLAASCCFGWDVGFDFRATQTFVVDPSYATFITTGTNVYPTTRTVNGQQITFGWESQSVSILSRDRGTWADPRLAGINCQPNDGNTSVFRVDLPSAGTYAIGLATGDGVGNNPMNNHLSIASGSTSVLSLLVDSGNDFGDASGQRWSAGAWPASNVEVQRTFAGTILRMTLGGVTDSNLTCMAHLRVTLIQAGSPVVPVGVGAFYL
jgi:hypothetical protein